MRLVIGEFIISVRGCFVYFYDGYEDDGYEECYQKVPCKSNEDAIRLFIDAGELLMRYKEMKDTLKGNVKN